MAEITGKECLIYIEATPGGGTFNKIAATQSDSVTINNSTIEVNTKDSGGFREIFAPGTIKNVGMSMSGVWEELPQQDQLLSLSMASDPAANFVFKLGGTRQLRGRFQVVSYEQSGETEGAASFSASFESDGTIEIEAAP